MELVKVQVKIPRFKMEEEYSLKEVLVSMGMVDAFSDSLSDFSGRRLVPDLKQILFFLLSKQFLIVLYITAGQAVCLMGHNIFWNATVIAIF